MLHQFDNFIYELFNFDTLGFDFFIFFPVQQLSIYHI